MDVLPFDCIVSVLEYLSPLDLSRVALVNQVSDGAACTCVRTHSAACLLTNTHCLRMEAAILEGVPPPKNILCTVRGMKCHFVGDGSASRG